MSSLLDLCVPLSEAHDRLTVFDRKCTPKAEKQKHECDCEQDQIGPRKFTRYRPLHEYQQVAKSRKQAEDKSYPDLPFILFMNLYLLS
jgi:hypothetical protein